MNKTQNLLERLYMTTNVLNWEQYMELKHCVRLKELVEQDIEDFPAYDYSSTPVLKELLKRSKEDGTI